MALRSTQTFVSVLGGNMGAMHVTSTYLCLLTGAQEEFEVSASSAIVLAQELVNGGTITPLAENTIEADHAVSVLGPRYASATSVVAANQLATSSIHMVSAVSTLAITQAVLAGTVEKTATTAIVLSQSADASGGSYFVVASSPVSITQAAVGIGPKAASAVSSVVLTQSAVGSTPNVTGDAETVISLSDSSRSGVLVKSAANGLLIVDAAYSAQDLEAESVSTVELVQAAAARPNRVFAENALELFDLTDNTDKRRSATTVVELDTSADVERVVLASSAISLSHSAVQGIIGVSASSALTLVDIARWVNILVVTEASALSLTQTAECNIFMESVQSTLELEDAVGVIKPIYSDAESELTTIEEEFDLDSFTFIQTIVGLSDTVAYQLIGTRQTSSIISFATQALVSHVRADGTDCVAESVLAVDQVARTSLQEDTSSAVVLSQSAVAQVSNALAEDTLQVAQSADYQLSTIANSLSAIGIKHSLAYVLEQGNTLCLYSPFVGDSSDPGAPTPPPTSYSAEHGTPGFRLQYPATGTVEDELILRAPNLGNIDRLSMTRINRETRGGTLIVFADPAWPKVESLLLSFSGLSSGEKDSLLTFISDHLGEEIRLIDWENRLWRGVIVNPQDPTVQDGKGCRFTASFEFEGEKV